MVDAPGKGRFEALYGLYAVIGALLVVLAVVLWFMVDAGREARLLASEGREVEATVTDLRRVETRRVDKDGRSYIEVDHYVTLRFDTPDQSGVKAEVPVSQTRYDALEKGMRVPIRYAASDPQIIEFEAGERAGEAKFLRWVAIGAVVLTTGLVLLALRLGRRRNSG